MGTNYYALLNVCEHCNKPEKEIHIGKSSYGWTFLFRYHGGEYYETFKEFKKFLKDKVIKDEYGKVITHKDFWETVKVKKKFKTHESHHNEIINLDGYQFLDCEFS